MSEFNPVCYKIHYDTQKYSISVVLPVLQKYGDVLVHDHQVLIFLFDGVTLKKIKSALVKIGLDNCFFENVCAETQCEQTNMVAMWFREQYEKRLYDYINTERGEQLDKICNFLNQKLQKGGEASNGEQQ